MLLPYHLPHEQVFKKNWGGAGSDIPDQLLRYRGRIRPPCQRNALEVRGTGGLWSWSHTFLYTLRILTQATGSMSSNPVNEVPPAGRLPERNRRHLLLRAGPFPGGCRGVS